MKVVIAGAGDVGFHLAQLLSSENQDITLIDINAELLDTVGAELDVMTIEGNSASIDTLRRAEVDRAELVLAMTTSETTNIVTAMLAKRLGAGQTVARIANAEFLEPEQKQIFTQVGIDGLISPSLLAAAEIERLVRRTTFTDVFEFEEGKFTLVGATLEPTSPLANLRLSQWPNLSGPAKHLRLMAILRGQKTIIPRGSTILHPNDHVYFISRSEELPTLSELIGKPEREVKRIMIAGGTRLAYETARLLEKEYTVKIIDLDRERCAKQASLLNNTLVINADPTNAQLLREEGLEYMDAFLALSPNSEANIIMSLTAKNHGVYRTIAQVENREYVHISQDIGVDTLINMKLIAANNVFRFVRKGSIQALTSLHGVDAEVIEYEITRDNRVVRHPLRDLHLPETALIGGVIRGEETFVPDGDFTLAVGDKVVVFALPSAISKLEKVFR